MKTASNKNTTLYMKMTLNMKKMISNRTNQAKSSKQNIQNKNYQTKPMEPNKTYQIKISKPTKLDL